MNKTLKSLPFLLILATSGLFSYRLYRLIEINSVNLLYLDQWDFLIPLFTGKNDWALFNWQHGPHREGLGLIITKWLYFATNWDVRAEGKMLFGFTVTAMVIALGVTYAIRKSFVTSDVIIPMIFLTTRHYGTFLETPNLAYSVFPLFLLTIYCAVILMKHIWFRVIAMTMLNFLLIFSGFGFFMGIITPLLFFYYIGFDVKSRRIYILGVVGCIITFVAYFQNYHWFPSVDCFYFPDKNPTDYLRFAAVMWGTFWGYQYVPYLINSTIINVFSFGATILLLGVYAVYKLSVHCINPKNRLDPFGLITIILLLFTLMFTAFTAIGRVCLSIEASTSSRYAMLLVPGIWGIYLFLSRSGFCAQFDVIRFIFMVVFMIAFIQSDPQNTQNAETTNKRKANWVACYKTQNNPFECSSQLKVMIHPNVQSIVPKLEFLKNAKLNLFSE